MPRAIFEAPMRLCRDARAGVDRHEMQRRIIHIRHHLALAGAKTIPGPLLRLERHHYHGVLAVYRVIPNPKVPQ